MYFPFEKSQKFKHLQPTFRRKICKLKAFIELEIIQYINAQVCCILKGIVRCYFDTMCFWNIDNIIYILKLMEILRNRKCFAYHNLAFCIIFQIRNQNTKDIRMDFCFDTLDLCKQRAKIRLVLRIHCCRYIRFKHYKCVIKKVE